MLQFYFLSVLLNVVVGFVLVFAAQKKHEVKKNPLDEDDFYAELDESMPDTQNEDDIFSDDAIEDEPFESKASSAFSSFLNEPLFQLVVGAVSFLVGFIKFGYTQDGIPFFGDFFTALSGFVGGAVLIAFWLDSRGGQFPKFPSSISSILNSSRRFIGFFCIASGVLHFIIPRVIFF